MSKFKLLLEVFKDTYDGFFDHKILKMSASLAYTTIFSMAPLLLVILYICDIFLSREAIEGAIFSQTKEFIGTNAASQLQTMIRGLSISDKGSLAATIGITVLMVGATSVFAEIQDSINTIWNIRPKIKSGFWLYLKSRLLSFGVIGSLGFIMIVSLGFSAVLDIVNVELFSNLTKWSVYILYATNVVITSLIITLLFGCIFAILPDAKISWKQVKVASITTTVLFMTGKFLISYYITKLDISSMYGTAGSFVVLMIWVYYSSVILYFGAQFSKSYAVKFASPIVASEFAEMIETVEIPLNAKTIQKADEESKEIKNADTLEIKTSDDKTEIKTTCSDDKKS